ncbi:MAG TPA: TonB-dependent receptor [Woeseiaceae bacterium]|nr:TonB-dependent receptor [Woeseiaceae bacterium]
MRERRDSLASPALLAILCAASLCAATPPVAADQAAVEAADGPGRDDEQRYDISIPAQPLAQALQQLAEQADIQVVFFSGATEGLMAGAISGTYTRVEALDVLLAGTGLRYVFLNSDSIAIQPVPDESSGASTAGEPAAETADPGLDGVTDLAVTPETPTGAFAMEEIVVTGTAARSRTKFESSVGISTFDRAEIARLAPSSTAELVSAVPGFWVESTAGTTQGNVFARGIVQDGGYRYVGLVEDGLPVYPVFELSFYNPDQFIRASESTARVEVVRGGTAPLFTTGAVGGTINFVNEKAWAAPALRAKAGWTDFDSRAVDAYWSTPLAGSWWASAGGYRRSSEGVRYPGYVADEGGHVRLELARVTQRSELSLYAKYLDDRSLFAVPIPLRGSPDNPAAVDGTSAGEYSLHSADLRAAGLPASAAEVGLDDSDLADGIHPRLLTAGARLGLDWDSGVSLSSHARFSDGDVSFNGIFTGAAPVTGAEFAAEHGVAPDFSYIAGGAPFEPGFLVQNHGHWAVHKDYRALQNDTRVNFAWQQHEIAVGAYLADFSMHDRWSLGNLLLTDVRDQPRRLALPGVTDPEGFTQYSFLNLLADYDGRIGALYVADEWSVNERLRVDVGARFDWTNIEASISRGQDGVDLDGDPETTYDVASLAGSERDRYDESFDYTAISAGFNYELGEPRGEAGGLGRRHALFGHVTRSAKLPHFDDIRNGVMVMDRVINVELGYKLAADDLAVFLTAFRTGFDNVPFNDILLDGSIVVRRAKTRTFGIELEGVYEPVDSVDVRFAVTLQDPEYREFSGASVDNSGNQVRRIPEVMARVVPTIRFAHGRGRAWLTVSHIGERYANDENTLKLPAYLKLDAGVEYTFGERWSAALNVDNLANEAGLTEGNPRTDVHAGDIGPVYNARPLFGRSLALAVRYSFRSGRS